MVGEEMKFWAKTTSDGTPGLSVFEHMVDVGCTARCLAEMAPEILDRFHITSKVVASLAALHDIGKISPGFQRKCQAWLDENGLSNIARNGCWDTSMESDHGKVSHAAIQQFLKGKGFSNKTGKFFSAVLGAHHGSLNPPNPRGYLPSGNIHELASGIDWDVERLNCAKKVWECFGGYSTELEVDDESPSLWWLAGLTTVADWIGSNERYFSTVGHEIENIPALAQSALADIGFRQLQIAKGLSFHDLFHDKEHPEKRWAPNEMQEKAFTEVKGSGVYIIEAPMGMGKTEAALWAAYRLLTAGQANGIYFALPTQATSNRIHLRMNEFLNRITSIPQDSRLIHGNSWLMDMEPTLNIPATEGSGKRTDDARIGTSWFSSAKRSLIAPFGVGTVDQALLGVVAAKHFFVRHFALAGKVVIIDEVHSYDLYTGTLIDKLITTLEGLGCTVIILSATLSGRRCENIISYPDSSSKETSLPYPLITGRHEGESIGPTAATPPPGRDVQVEFMDVDHATLEAIELARAGGAVLWICDTVDAAQKQFKRFEDIISEEFPLGLLHSRFPFYRREALEMEWMERFGKDSTSRCGSILVSTQVVEQSVDLDADLMISELAPTDMLLQRMGRLWRHEREGRPISEPRFCILTEARSLKELKTLTAQEIKETLGSKGHVYEPYVLLRTLSVWQGLGRSQVSIPAQIRELIEATYQAEEDEPDAWLELFYDCEGKAMALKQKALMNSNVWTIHLPDEEGVQTRLNEIETVSLVLCRYLDKKKANFIDGSSSPLVTDKFSLPLAQAIHKNLVKVPEYCFDGAQPCPQFKEYLFGRQCAGIVNEDGTVSVNGLKGKYRLFYSPKMGLVIDKES